MTEHKERAVVLLSGGLDSATTLAVALQRNYEPWVLSFDYGQKASRELEAAAAICRSLGVEHHLILPLRLDSLVVSALTSKEAMPSPEEIKRRFGIPDTYVPARNTVFLALALGFAESIGSYRVFIGANDMDFSGYPDCRPEFFRAFNQLAGLATAEGVGGGRKVQVETPLMNLSKGEIIRLGLSLGVDYGLTVSCYAPLPDGSPCLRCESCQIRIKGFRELGLPDPCCTPSSANR